MFYCTTSKTVLISLSKICFTNCIYRHALGQKNYGLHKMNFLEFGFYPFFDSACHLLVHVEFRKLKAFIQLHVHSVL